jgi:hypothetical protein
MAVTDNFANLANLAITESAANTLTFEELKTGAGVFEKMAMVIHRIEYETTVSVLALLAAGDDELEVAWVTSDQITGLAKDKAQVIDRLRVMPFWKGSPASATVEYFPLVHDFSTLPSGGIIVPATDLYLACKGTSVASASYWRSSIYFTYRSLKAEEYWELVEATRALS